MSEEVISNLAAVPSPISVGVSRPRRSVPCGVSDLERHGSYYVSILSLFVVTSLTVSSIHRILVCRRSTTYLTHPGCGRGFPELLTNSLNARPGGQNQGC